jgi:LPS-assembly lipoprotein
MRVLLILASVALLAACGFQPRAQLSLPATIGPVKVEVADQYSPLGLELATALERAGATGHVEGSPSSTLKITSESFTTRPLSVDQLARVREYISVYRVGFVLLDAAGKPVIDPQELELSREYTYDISESAGSPAEQELIQRELRREMEASILRRLDVVLRTRS